MRLFLALVGSIAWSAFEVNGAAQLRQDRQVPFGKGSKLLSFRDAVSHPQPALQPTTISVNWINHGSLGDGFRAFVHPQKGLVVENFATGTQQELLSLADIPPNNGFKLNVDNTFVVWAMNVTKGYRHSYSANYIIQNVKTKEIRPLVPGQNGDVQLVEWNPKNPLNLVFVWKNNIYFWDSATITPVTTDGSPAVYHGVPDWVYEEEVIEGRSTLWYSPDGEYLAFLSFNDTNVPVYTVPYYMDKNRKPMPYPRELKIRYPKPGFPNPIVKASVVKIDAPKDIQAVPVEKAFTEDNLVIGEAAWLTDKHDQIIFRCFNRPQNHDRHLLYKLSSKTADIVRERDAKDGWLENTKAIKYVGKLDAQSGDGEFYIDLSDVDNWMHIYLYPVNGGSPKQLTEGEWEIRKINSVDLARNIVHYTSSQPHPTESKVGSVSIITGETKSLVPNDAAFWSASFSPNANYYVLNYEGPNVPYQELYAINQTDKPIRIVNNNARAYTALQELALPTTQFFDLKHPSGFNLSAKLQLPPNFDETKKYPVLLTPYGGPNSQEVTKGFSGGTGLGNFAVSSPDLGYVAFSVDNRGTGFRGRAFRNTYYKAMGTVEPEDQIWAAEWLAQTYPWVDRDRIGIWGWSNGGYVSAKVVEYASKIISFAIATAPTDDCRLYDSIYAERYMGLPQENAAVYDRAMIRNATGFKNIAGGFLLQHGTGDDNVHFAHSASLADLLMAASVPPSKFQAQFFPDSDHNINTHNQQSFLYAQVAEMLQKQKQRVVGAKKSAWEIDQEAREDAEDDQMDFTGWGKRNIFVENIGMGYRKGMGGINAMAWNL
ncbi:hypothetical protein BT63DRAFT_111158 [Microthyrium microscopicum]|uniref:dipeptidyl-peptidase IV n=1 Tax=Microthyrium microscopicum TaxID=703497 RepID=A0A6A6TX45_9PEZI|nr:hypothetical protein BT63DRAFT_111158 [Microthyrium microscopicum]